MPGRDGKVQIIKTKSDKLMFYLENYIVLSCYRLSLCPWGKETFYKHQHVVKKSPGQKFLYVIRLDIIFISTCVRTYFYVRFIDFLT